MPTSSPVSVTRRSFVATGASAGVAHATAVAVGGQGRAVALLAPVHLWWEPADGPDGRDFGAHGDFDDRSWSRSAQRWASRHRGLLASVGTGLAASALGWRARAAMR